jgi:hypothetical protein
MSSLKRVRLAILFLVVLLLLVGASESALGGESKIVVALARTAPDGDPDATASGQATLGNIRIVDWIGNPSTGYPLYQAGLKVTCAGLTPGAADQVHTTGFDPKASNGMFVTWYFQASGSGNGGAGGQVKWGGWTGPLSVSVVRVDPGPNGTLLYTTVLAGKVY